MQLTDEERDDIAQRTADKLKPQLDGIEETGKEHYDLGKKHYDLGKHTNSTVVSELPNSLVPTHHAPAIALFSGLLFVGLS